MSTENRKKGERKILSPIPEEYDITQMEERLSSLESSVNRFEQDVEDALIAVGSFMDKVNQLETKTDRFEQDDCMVLLRQLALDVEDALIVVGSFMDKVNQLETKTDQLGGGLRHTKKRKNTKKRKMSKKRKKTKKRKYTKKRN